MNQLTRRRVCQRPLPEAPPGQKPEVLHRRQTLPGLLVGSVPMARANVDGRGRSYAAK
jgi:hypothetical protein